MKIAYILHNQIIDGSLISWMNLVQSLVDENHEIVAICSEKLSANSEFQQFLSSNKVRVYNCLLYLGPFKLQDNASIKQKLRWCKKYIAAIKHKFNSLKQIYRVLKQERPSIVHTNIGVIHEGFWVSKLLNIPHVWHLREYQDKDWGLCIYPSKRIYSWLLRQTNVVSITKDILEYFNLEKSSKAQVIYNGICSAEDKAEITEKENYFVSACTIAPNKGIQDTISAFEEFYKTHSEYKFYILGNDRNEYAEDLKTYVQQKDLSDVIIFKGYQNKEQVYQFMQKAKALVVASYNEGFGRMTAEAAFSGTLVIGRNTAGTKEILDVIGGLPFEGDYTTIVKQMDAVHDFSADEYMNITLNAQSIAEKQYSIESNVKKISELYNKIIS